MPFEAVGVLLMLMATMFALMGHFNSDHKTLVACGLYILGGKLCSVPYRVTYVTHYVVVIVANIIIKICVLFKFDHVLKCLWEYNFKELMQELRECV
jgi:hypothetical protein